MRAYPSVNWWPGNLRSHESKACFAARFRDLNGISSRRCLEFLDLGPLEGAPADAGEVERLSSILCEPAQDVESILQPSIRFVGCGRYAPPPNTRDRQFIRYCEACANLGYHSYLHEAEWLARCPFHLCELKEALIKAYTGSIMRRHLDALGVLMRKHCQSWPRCDSSLASSSGEHLTALGDWVVFATRAAACLSSAEVWCSAPEGEFGTLSLAQAFGQLRAITPMPEAIETLLTEAGGKWRMRSRLFAAEAKLELERLNALGLRFPRVLEVYRGISAFAANPPSFVTCLNAVKDSLRARHGNCHCEWGLFRGGWELHWIKVYPDEQPYLSTPCPFEFALAELEGGWGGLGAGADWPKGRSRTGTANVSGA
ncbi:hypothetical protein CUJ91_32235 (plasmid) [Paraburkholderia graminis]|nr:hypothetical protein CUJ91_32235 [Paraburkholderia graminis]